MPALDGVCGDAARRQLLAHAPRGVSGAVNRHPDINVRGFIDRLCGGDGEGISPSRLNEMLRTLDQLNPAGS